MATPCAPASSRNWSIARSRSSTDGAFRVAASPMRNVELMFACRMGPRASGSAASIAMRSRYEPPWRRRYPTEAWRARGARQRGQPRPWSRGPPRCLASQEALDLRARSAGRPRVMADRAARTPEERRQVGHVEGMPRVRVHEYLARLVNAQARNQFSGGTDGRVI